MARIVHIVPRDGLGGVETAARAMAARDDLPCDFKLLFIAYAGGGGTGARGSLWNPVSYGRVLRKLLRLDPEVLLCSLWRTVPVAIAAKRLRPNLKLVTFVHCDTSIHAADEYLTRLAMRTSDAIWADSHATLDARVPPRLIHRTKVISFVTERMTPPPAPPLSARFVSWARMTEQKGVDRAIRFIGALRERGVNATLDLWGPDNGLQATLTAQRDAAGLTDYIQFRGVTAREHLAEIAAGNSFYLQLSRYEGMAMAVVEAMQLGLVPVVTAVGQMAHYVAEGVNGMIVDAEAPEAAIEHIIDVLAVPARHAAMRDAAIETWARARLYPDDVCVAAQALLRLNPTATQ